MQSGGNSFAPINYDGGWFPILSLKGVSPVLSICPALIPIGFFICLIASFLAIQLDEMMYPKFLKTTYMMDDHVQIGGGLLKMGRPYILAIG